MTKETRITMSLTPEELKAKIQGARAVGTPIFMTTRELEWLRDTLLGVVQEINVMTPFETNQDKLNKLFAVSIGIKCAKAVLEGDLDEDAKDGAPNA